VKAVSLLRSDPSLASDEKNLWNRVTNEAAKEPNKRMGVVLALWSSGLIAPG
jgi:hypothetical protein